MDADQLIQLSINGALGTAALITLAKWVAGRIERTETAAVNRENLLREEAISREKVLREEIKELRVEHNFLEKEIRTDLVGLLKETKISLEQSTVTNQQVLEVLKTINSKG